MPQLINPHPFREIPIDKTEHRRSAGRKTHRRRILMTLRRKCMRMRETNNNIESVSCDFFVHSVFGMNEMVLHRQPAWHSIFSDSFSFSFWNSNEMAV